MAGINEIKETLMIAYKNSGESWLNVYAAYSNRLYVLADSDDLERIEYLAQVVGELERIITMETMKDSGWYLDYKETYPKWLKLH